MSASIKIIESENFRSTLTEISSGTWNFKAITPEGKALLRLKKMGNPFKMYGLSAMDVLNDLEEFEGKVEALKNI